MSIDAWNDSYLDDYDFYLRLHNPKSVWLYEYEKEGGKGKCLNSEYFQAGTAMWDDGYKLIEYFYVLYTEMLPTHADLFAEVYQLMDTIGNSGSILYDNQTIQTWESFKDIKSFLWDNYVEKGGNGTHLTLPLIASVSKSASDLISQYNAYQDALNHSAEGKADNAKNSKEEPEKWVKKIDDDVKIKDLIAKHYPISSFKETSVPATSSPTTPMNYSDYYRDLYAPKN